MRTKLLAVVAIVWAATIGVYSAVLYNHRTYQLSIIHGARYYDWESWWAWTIGVTLAALAAAAIITVLTRKPA